MIDDLDLKILRNLGGDGREPILNLAKRLGVPNSTVRQRIKRLTDMGVIHFSCEVDPKFFTHLLLVFVGIMAPRKHRAQLDELYAIPHVQYVSSTTGKYDYIALVAAPSPKVLVEIIYTIDDIEGVEHTESFLTLENDGLFLKCDRFSKIYENHRNADD